MNHKLIDKAVTDIFTCIDGLSLSDALNALFIAQRSIVLLNPEAQKNIIVLMFNAVKSLENDIYSGELQ